MKPSAFILFFALAAPALPQTFTGTILGFARDSSGAFVPNVRVRALETTTNAERLAVSNDSGYFELALLPPGIYRLDAQQTGFERFTRDALKLDTGQKLEIDVMLSPGDVTEVVEVKAETPLLDTSTSTVAQLIDNRKVTGIPLSNRNLAPAHQPGDRKSVV